MALAIFDLDNTLLAGDSDYLWGTFLCDQGIVDRDLYEQENRRFYQEYKEGRLDIIEFLQFSLYPLSQHPLDQLQQWHRQFMRQYIDPLITAEALALVDEHRRKGDLLMIITATNAFVTAPIAERFGINHLIATEPRIIEGRYTGEVAGEPSYRQGKVHRLEAWLQQHQQSLDGSWFYSDSHNDLPLLERVEHPVAVNPDQALEQRAQQHGWPIIRLHRKL
ncbi:MAG TPA: HAD-IB family hydrolase [Gammaproteobacteria bacterium]|nr:HAD-IB family hydrolase [Gammaproteobacteria bacterium]